MTGGGRIVVEGQRPERPHACAPPLRNLNLFGTEPSDIFGAGLLGSGGLKAADADPGAIWQCDCGRFWTPDRTGWKWVPIGWLRSWLLRRRLDA